LNVTSPLSPSKAIGFVDFIPGSTPVPSPIHTKFPENIAAFNPNSAKSKLLGLVNANSGAGVTGSGNAGSNSNVTSANGVALGAAVNGSAVTAVNTYGSNGREGVAGDSNGQDVSKKDNSFFSFKM
jgi:hypothetical protein